jgi:hypothetical protein
VSPRSNRQRSGVLARFGMKSLVAALLLAPALSLGLAEPIADIAFAKKHNRGGGGVSTEDFSAPRYSSTITINDNGPASPYGSSITVSGLSGTVIDVNLILRNFSHDRPSDVAVMLAHQGRASILMREAGGNVALQNANIVLDNDASSTLPENATIVSNLAYEPFDYALEPESQFGGAAPNNGDNNANHANRQYLDFFNGTTANGTWTLWVRDELAPISGAMGGWQLEIVTNDDLPFIAIDEYKTKQGKKLNVSANQGVLRSDPDKGQGNLTADLVTEPTKGKVNFHSDGSFVYKPKDNKRGTDTFEYVINDELGASIDGNGLVEIKIKKDKKHKKHKGKKNKHKKRNRR